MTCSAIMDFSTVAILIRAGIEPRDEDRRTFRKEITKLCSRITSAYTFDADFHGQSFVKCTTEKRLETFIKSLNDMIGTSPGAHVFCSIAWREALHYDIPFTSDISIVSSQISLDLKSLEELGMSGVATGGLSKLEFFMNDPRVSADGLACSTVDGAGSTLLHIALKTWPTNLAGFRGRLATAQKLLEAGCMPSAINKDGNTPLHVWTWAEDTNETEKPEVESFIRILFDKGASIHSKGKSGYNALHRWASNDQVKTLRATLDVVGADEAAIALAATDDGGFTPLMRALQQNHTVTSKLLIQYGRNEFGSLDNSKLLSLVGGIESVSLLRLLVAIGFPIESDSVETALHHINRTTPVGCIRVLKEHLPDACSYRHGGRFPIEIYLREWSLISDDEIIRDKEEALNPSFEVLGELVAIKSHETRDEGGLTVWEYATVRIINYMRLNHCDDLATYQNFRRSELYSKAVGYLMKLGYMRSHERANGESGLIPLLSCLAPSDRNWKGLWPVTAKLLAEVVPETARWPQFRTSQLAFDLLYASFHTSHQPLLRILLEYGVPLTQNGVILDTLGMVCAMKYDPPYNYYKTRAQTVLDFCPEDTWQLADSTPQDYGLIHHTRSSWLAEELLRRGANPNLRVPLCYGHFPALVYHLMNGRSDVASCLLRWGAKPEDANVEGINAIHAALISGYTGILEEIRAVLNLSEDAWHSTCTISEGKDT